MAQSALLKTSLQIVWRNEHPKVSKKKFRARLFIVRPHDQARPHERKADRIAV